MDERYHFQSIRFVIRPPDMNDAHQIVDCVDDPEMAVHLARVPNPYTQKDARNWIKYAAKARQKGHEYAFLVTRGTQVIGSVGFNRAVADAWELGYWVRKSWWSKGVATEAARALMDWGRTTLNAEHFVAGHFKDNPASGRVLIKLGFACVGEREMFGLARGQKAPALRYVHGKTPAEYALQAEPH